MQGSQNLLSSTVFTPINKSPRYQKSTQNTKSYQVSKRKKAFILSNNSRELSQNLQHHQIIPPQKLFPRQKLIPPPANPWRF